DGTDRDRRRLSRRGAQRRQAGPRVAWQEAYRGGGRNHTRGQANPLEVAPREGFPPCRNRDLGAAQFPSRQHRCQRRPALASLIRAPTPLSLDLVRRYGDELLQAVDYLEQQGVTHRDIKPDSIGIGAVG